jgi:TolB-like protein
MTQVSIQVVSEKGTGYLPEVGTLQATRSETESGVQYILDDSVANYGGRVLTASEVVEV